MEFQHELIIPNEGFPFKVFLFEGGNGNYVREKHWHTSVEIFAVMEGRLDFFVNKDEYPLKAGEQIIINSNEIHSIHAVPKNYSVNTRLQKYQIPIEEIRNGQFRSSHIPSVPLNKFENEPFIILRSDNDTGKRALTICQENHFSPSVVFRLDQQMTAYNIACLGMGITFIGDLLLSRVPTNSELVFYKLPGQSSKRTVFFYWKKGRYISRAMEEFLKLPFS